MAGLYRARMHRAHRDLVHAFAFDADERIGVRLPVSGCKFEVPGSSDFGLGTCDLKLASLRSGKTSSGHAAWRSHLRWSAAFLALTPSRSCTARCIRLAAGKMSDRSGNHAPSTGSARISQSRLHRQRRVHRESAPPVAVVRAPQRDQPPALVAHLPAHRAPLAARRRARATPASRPAARVKLDVEIFDLHPQPISAAACRYHSARYGGM